MCIKYMDRVKQSDVARYVGLERTTVSRILNRAPGYSYNEQTKIKVFKAAEKLGYRNQCMFRTQRRIAKRKKIHGKVRINVRLMDNSLFSTFEGVAEDISSSGMLLKPFPGGKMPTEPFYLEITLLNKPEEPKMRATVIRLGSSDPNDLPIRTCQFGFGLQFIDDDD